MVTAQAHAQQSIETLATAHVGVLLKRRRQLVCWSHASPPSCLTISGAPIRTVTGLALTGQCVLLPSLDARQVVEALRQRAMPSMRIFPTKSPTAVLNRFSSMVHRHPLQDTGTGPIGFGQEQILRRRRKSTGTSGETIGE